RSQSTLPVGVMDLAVTSNNGPQRTSMLGGSRADADQYATCSRGSRLASPLLYVKAGCDNDGGPISHSERDRDRTRRALL
ncbi:unnamed protein product, partial [Gadus morhua 'NCC']